MQISRKTKYYLILGYNVLKIIGNICAFLLLCYWSWHIISFVPKGYAPLWEPYFSLHEFKYYTTQIICTIFNLCAVWKMARNLFKIHSLKYHIVFWLTPFVLAVLYVLFDNFA